jgi:4-amino-4-deoxy-L-arabinose transferase-like glycosyltransferase
MVFFRHHLQPLPFRTYFEELATHHLFNVLDAIAAAAVDFSQVPEFQNAGSHLYNFFTYPYLFFNMDGAVFCLLALVGIIGALWGRSRADVLLLVWFVIPFVLLSLGLATSIRYGLVFLPAVVLLAARSILTLSAMKERLHQVQRIPDSILAGILVSAIVLSNLLSNWNVRELRCSYEQPAEFLGRHGSKHVSLQYPVSMAYFGTENVKQVPLTMEQLKEYYEEGYRYFLVDFRKFFFQLPFDTSGTGQMIDSVEKRLSPVSTFKHPCCAAPSFLFEVNVFFWATLDAIREADQRGYNQIRIYDLSELFEENKGSHPQQNSY